ncbi:MAG: HU family DNA-binding protein [Fusobacteriaceae bacterium]
MTKKEFIDRFALEAGDLTKKEAEKMVNAFLSTVEHSLVAGESVSFVGWGKWEIIERSAREVRNPQSGEKIEVPAKKVVKFRVGKTLETAVATPKKIEKTAKKTKK